jgi:hypothetical protein
MIEGKKHVATAERTSWYDETLLRLQAEVQYVRENLEESTLPSEHVLAEVKDFLSIANGFDVDIPLISVSYNGDVNLRWGKGYEALLVSFCYDGLDHYCHRYEEIERHSVFEVLRNR